MVITIVARRQQQVVHDMSRRCEMSRLRGMSRLYGPDVDVSVGLVA